MVVVDLLEALVLVLEVNHKMLRLQLLRLLVLLQKLLLVRQQVLVPPPVLPPRVPRVTLTRYYFKLLLPTEVVWLGSVHLAVVDW